MLGKYLHYGYASPVYVALRIRKASNGQENIGSYVEEPIMRRELSIYFRIYKTTGAEIPHAANRQLSRSEDLAGNALGAAYTWGFTTSS
jgi:hypothetical protein